MNLTAIGAGIAAFTGIGAGIGIGQQGPALAPLLVQRVGSGGQAVPGRHPSPQL